jgi:YHS domain-containing protein
MKKTLVITTIMLTLFSCSNHTATEEQTINPVLLSHTNNKASCVYLSGDENNNPVISWCETDTAGSKYFFMAYFDGTTNKFDKTIPVPIEQNTNIHEEGMPKIAIKKDGTIIAVYETSAPTPENQWAGFIHYVQSSDKGKTWTQPLCVHDDTASGKDNSFASLTRLSDGEIGVCWLGESFDPKQEGRSVLFAKTNGSKGFQHEILIDSFACECCRTAISSDNKGNASILFRNILPGSIRDISCSTSPDNGETFNTPVSFSNDEWVVKGCPHNGPSVVTTGKNSYAVWFSGANEKGVHYAELDDNRNLVSKKYISENGRFIQLCLSQDNERIIAYNETAVRNDTPYTKIVLDKIDKDNIYSEDVTGKNGHATYPVVRCNNNDVIVAWEENDKIFYKTIAINSITNPAQEVIQHATFAQPDFSKINFAVAKDLSCGMPLRAGISDTAHYKGKIYGFCSNECKEKFLKNPENYLSKK